MRRAGVKREMFMQVHSERLSLDGSRRDWDPDHLLCPRA